MHADPDRILNVVADIERWPLILPHYRSVTVKGMKDGGRLVEMLAMRGRIPVWCTTVQRLDAGERRVYYRHVGGPTRGIYVEWRIEPTGDGVRVSVTHLLTLSYPIIRTLPGRCIVRRCLIKDLIDMTLSRIKAIVESEDEY